MIKMEFQEIQKFKQWWVRAIILIVDFIAMITIFNFLIEFKDNLQDTPLVISIILILLSIIAINYLFIFSKLETKINSNGIYIKYFPFHFKYQHYTWEDLEKIYVRQYSPIGEYGGWGYRISIIGKGRAFNTSGDMGLQLIFKNGKKLLIGTQKALEIRELLQNLNRYSE
jgi:hypothetical protein